MAKRIARRGYFLQCVAFALISVLVSFPASAPCDETPATSQITLHFWQGEKDPASDVPLTLKSPERMCATLARIAFTSHPTFVLMPRSDAAKADIDAALAVARRELPRLLQGPIKTEGMSDDESNRAWNFQGHAWNAMSGIFAMAGDASDIKLLLTSGASVPSWKRLQIATICGYTEQRLGVLETGQLAELIKKSDKQWAMPAALQLHNFGSRKGDEVLLAYKRSNDENFDWDVTQAFLDSPDSRVLPFMRAIAEQSAERDAKADPPYTGAGYSLIPPAFLYLCAYGTPQDRQRLETLKFPLYTARLWAALAQDPMPLARLLAKESDLTDTGQMAPLLRDFGEEKAAEMGQELEDIVYGEAYEKTDATLTDSLRESKALPTYNRYRAYTSFCRPSILVGEYFYKSKIDLDETVWVPSITIPDYHDAYINDLVDGKLRLDSAAQLDYLSDGQLQKEIDAKQGRAKIAYCDLLLAAHRVGSRAFFSTQDQYHDGIERRPYTLAARDKDGALSGLLEVKPSLEGSKLRLALKVVQTPYYHAGDFISAALLGEGKLDEWQLHKYVKDGGKALLKSVTLRRGTQSIALTEKGADEGAFLYEAVLDKAALDGWYLDAELSFFDQSPPHLVYDLFASDYAREQKLHAR